jgi:hypothetical protein
MSVDQPQDAARVPQDPIPSKRLSPQDPFPIRVVLPAEVAFSIDLVQRTIVNLAERLGCPSCFSGANCVFQLERDFVVDPGGVVHGTHELFRGG